MEQEQIQKKIGENKPFWVWWSIAAMLIAAVFGVYMWKSWRLGLENKRFEVSIENTQKRLLELAPGSTEQFLKKQQEVIKKAEKHRVNWSSIMEQIIGLETPAVRFASVSIAGEKVSASCHATSWKSLSDFIEVLKRDPRINTVRISSTSVLTPPLSGANQAAEITFHFSPQHDENK